MRLPALFALAALVGLAACDSAKVSELTGAKPATTQITAACPPAATVAPACPPAQPAMAPEAAKPAVAAAGTPAAQPAPAVHRVQSHAKARAWAQRHRVKQVRHVVATSRRHAAQPPVRHFAYAGGYTGDEAYAERRDERRYAHPPVYAQPDEGYAQDRYGYERRDDGRDAYRYEHREGSVEQSESSSNYERREGGYSSGSVSGGGYVSGGSYGDNCNCRPQAAGRDRQGFLTWPGKR